MGDYNKPITARIQHSTSKGMKIQEPLLDIGSVANANKTLIDGEGSMREAGKADVSGSFNAGMDSQKSSDSPESPATASKYGAMLAANIEKGMSPKEAGKQAAEDIKKEPKSAATKINMPKAMAKNYKKGYYGA